MDYSIFKKELEHIGVTAKKWYGVENLSFRMGDVHLVTYKLAVAPLNKDLPW